MDTEAFKNYLADRCEAVLEAGGDVFAMMGQTPVGRIPVGLISEDVKAGPRIRTQIMPHAWWFPEASARNRLECVAAYLVDAKREHNILIIAEQPHWPFYSHLGHYGILRGIGRFRGYLADGGDVTLYQGVRA